MPYPVVISIHLCRSWRELALSDELWQQHLHLVFSAAARCQYRKQPMQQQQQQSRQLQQNLTSSTAAPYGLDSSHSLTEGHRAAGVAVQDSSTAAMDSIILSGSHHLLQQQSQHQCQHQGAYQRFRQAAQRELCYLPSLHENCSYCPLIFIVVQW